MGKFVNPKKIKGQDKLNRIKDLMGQMNILTESKTLSELELIKKGPNGVVYGIIRENHDYFIKTSDKTSGKFLAEDFNYVGGLQNKYEERYKSYADAIKHLNMKFDMLNESFGIMENNNIFESDGVAMGGIKSGGLGFVLEKNDSPAHPGQTCEEAHPGQNGKEAHSWTEEVVDTTPELEANGKEILDEEEPIDEKTVLKVDAPTPPPAPAPEPMAVEDEVEVDEFGGEEMGDEEFGAEEEIDVEGGEEEGDEYTKKIQKLTGKVGQMLRDKDEPDSELDKYVINSIVSAIDWEEIDDEDVEDIIAKIEGEDEEDGEGDEFGGEEVEVDLDAEEEIEEPAEELAESRTFTKKSLMESFLKKNANLALKKVLKEQGMDIKFDIQHNPEYVKWKQSSGPKSTENIFLEILKTVSGYNLLTKPMATAKMLGKMLWETWDDKKLIFSPILKKYELDDDAIDELLTNPPDDLYLRLYEMGHSTKGLALALAQHKNMQEIVDILLPNRPRPSTPLRENQAICEECMGGGCASCGDVSVSLNGEEGWAELEDPMEENLAEIFSNTDMEAGDDVGVVEEMDVTTALATGQDYLHATGDLDRDGDKIPNRLDLDNNADGSIDHGMGNKMYDWPEHILGRKGDRDSDGIPNKYDDDVDGDGRDDDYVEVGLDDIMGNNPVKEPDVKPPTTTPGTKPRKPRWREITRPGVDPRPKAEKNRRRASTIKRGMY